ncbi:hypothetical protein [Aquimarina sediminis]|uniref:hypothetical protein n=1 Tax=Aquimarina sediminis TaxID=2070536 RepID=UPI000CA02CD2|nr:hypothetical protein [Aquimarina sediminis]
MRNYIHIRAITRNHTPIKLFNNQITNCKIFRILFLVLSFSISPEIFSQTKSFNILRGIIKENGHLAVGISMNIAGTLIQTTSQINGDFQIKKEIDKDLELIINPCCTDFCPSRIKVEKNVFFIEINCVCKTSRRHRKSKVIVIKLYKDKEKIKQRKYRYTVCK